VLEINSRPIDRIYAKCHRSIPNVIEIDRFVYADFKGSKLGEKIIE
jgi:hypothetical protein